MRNGADEPWSNVLWQFGDYAGGSRLKAAWQHATGKGVHVGIIDDGIDARHAELAGQLDAGRSFDLVRSRAGFSGEGGSHGTAVAGVIGAAADGVGLVGGAYGATLAMLRVGFGAGGLDLLEHAVAQTARFDVTNCSWGFTTSWVDPAETPELADMQASITQAALLGRGGLGSAVVFAAGNNRETGGWTSAHALQGQVETITVASVNWRGVVSGFSTPGPSILVAAGGDQIWTLDVTGDAGFVPGDYARVSGTSFAAPLVTSIVALMLEANPGLGLRDVQEILAVSASQTDGAATRNAGHLLGGGGLAFSNDLGFGVAQADRAVRLAKSWLVGTVAHDFQNASHLVAVGQAARDGLDFVMGAMSVQKITLSISLTEAAWGHVNLDLISPSGTVSHMLTSQVAPGAPASGSWDLVSNAFWGEASAGNWHLRISAPDGTDIGMPSASLDLLGDSDGPDRIVLTDSFGGATLAPIRATILDAAAATGGLTLDLAGGLQSLNGTVFRLEGSAWVGTVIGAAGNDRLAGTDQAETLVGGEGADQLYGRGGDDVLAGGAGRQHDRWRRRVGRGPVRRGIGPSEHGLRWRQPGGRRARLHRQAGQCRGTAFRRWGGARRGSPATARRSEPSLPCPARRARGMGVRQPVQWPGPLPAVGASEQQRRQRCLWHRRQ